MYLGMPWKLHIKKSGVEEGCWEIQLQGPSSGPYPLVSHTVDKFFTERGRSHDNNWTLTGWITFRIADDSVGPIRIRSGFLHGLDEQGTTTSRARVRDVKVKG